MVWVGWQVLAGKLCGELRLTPPGEVGLRAQSLEMLGQSWEGRFFQGVGKKMAETEKNKNKTKQNKKKNKKNHCLQDFPYLPPTLSSFLSWNQKPLWAAQVRKASQKKWDFIRFERES